MSTTPDQSEIQDALRGLDRCGIPLYSLGALRWDSFSLPGWSEDQQCSVVQVVGLQIPQEALVPPLQVLRRRATLALSAQPRPYNLIAPRHPLIPGSPFPLGWLEVLLSSATVTDRMVEQALELSWWLYLSGHNTRDGAEQWGLDYLRYLCGQVTTFRTLGGPAVEPYLQGVALRCFTPYPTILGDLEGAYSVGSLEMQRLAPWEKIEQSWRAVIGGGIVPKTFWTTYNAWWGTTASFLLREAHTSLGLPLPCLPRVQVKKESEEKAPAAPASSAPEELFQGAPSADLPTFDDLDTFDAEPEPPPTTTKKKRVRRKTVQTVVVDAPTRIDPEPPPAPRKPSPPKAPPKVEAKAERAPSRPLVVQPSKGIVPPRGVQRQYAFTVDVSSLVEAALDGVIAPVHTPEEHIAADLPHEILLDVLRVWGLHRLSDACLARHAPMPERSKMPGRKVPSHDRARVNMGRFQADDKSNLPYYTLTIGNSRPIMLNRNQWDALDRIQAWSALPTPEEARRRQFPLLPRVLGKPELGVWSQAELKLACHLAIKRQVAENQSLGGDFQLPQGDL